MVGSLLGGFAWDAGTFEPGENNPNPGCGHGKIIIIILHRELYQLFCPDEDLSMRSFSFFLLQICLSHQL